jgi:MFS family permease
MASTGLHNWGRRLSAQYNQLYALNLGANALDLGFINGLTAAISCLFSIPLGWAAERYSVKRVMLLGFVCAALSSALFALAGHWWMLIPAFVIGSQLVRIMPLTDILFISTTEPEQRASVMSLSRVIWGIMNIFAPITAAIVVEHFGGINSNGIRPLYYVQLLLTLFVIFFLGRYLIPLSRTVERKGGLISDDSGFLQGYKNFFRGEKWLKRWLFLRVVSQFGTNMTLPFVPLWTALIIQIPAGMLADKIGRKKVYFLLRPACYLGTILMILAPKPEYLIVVGILGAVALGRVQEVE